MTERDPAVADALHESFLAQVPEPIVGTLTGSARLHEIPAGHVFISPDQPHRCGILVDGLACVYRVRPDGSQLTMRRVRRGGAVGVKAMVGSSNDVAVVAITDCVFLPLDAKQLVELGWRHPGVGMAIAQEVSRRLDDTQTQADSTVRGVLERVAGALLDLSVDGRPLEVTISQGRLAERIGASREAVGRALRKLSQSGLIRQYRARLVIADPVRLHSVLNDGPMDEDIRA